MKIPVDLASVDVLDDVEHIQSGKIAHLPFALSSGTEPFAVVVVAGVVVGVVSAATDTGIVVVETMANAAIETVVIIIFIIILLLLVHSVAVMASICKAIVPTDVKIPYVH